ncbi:hypothetical protein EXS70_04565 [Candidatus Peribacteria bacterium]|nr:hypothetical protein [Candidatus Peribacteria bacterium]
MRQKNLIIGTIVLLIVGAVCGWFLWLWLNPGALSPVSLDDPTKATKAKSHTGYCCTKIGSACESVSDPGLCFRGGGKAFNAVQRNCDYYCYNVKP